MDPAFIPVGSQAGDGAAIAPIHDYLSELLARFADVEGGSVADYIPELSKADPRAFGIALSTVDGETYSVGDAFQTFTIQSVSKPFMYGYALQRFGREAVLRHVGVEPTGEAFNSIVLDESENRPFNPMVNAGAIAVAELMGGDTQDERIANMGELFSRFAGRPLDINEAVFQSEKATGHRNRAIAYMMLNTGMIERDPEDVLDLYFRQCSINVTCRDLSIMAATLANDGTNPLTGDQIIAPEYVRDVLTVMNSCGMYNYAGQWSYEVGMPAKSGVSGGILAVIPGQVGVSVYAPAIDGHGNSVRGVKVCQAISSEFELHAFHNRTNVRNVVRRDYRGDKVRSNRLRAPEQRKVLSDGGDRIVAVEVQGGLFFGSTEILLRRLTELSPGADYMIVDFRRVHLADDSACRLIARAASYMADGGPKLMFCEIAEDGPLKPLLVQLREAMAGDELLLFEDADAALEWCEDQLLDTLAPSRSEAKFALSELEIFKGLDPSECRMIEGLLRPLIFERGEVIIREGDAARLFFVVARGTASVQIGVSAHGRQRMRRVASIGPGLTFGEMALLDGGTRSATIVADERVVCYGLAVEALHELAEDHPNIMITILGNLTRDFSERLRHANAEIRALE
ncbi:Glutaminase 2 [Methyloligella halotolerans]|uniref:Glutaminase n=1 Tax=Methyloligella halotolerans TaxID=1177755 RepID=A0A1E2S1B7_9HYPH|nr:glutaminase A [Methyloligella halotolerans]ODA68244.1 Glutaminase 2 [Methyloligella halotolerans]